MIKFIKNWLPVLIWAALIFYLSSRPGLNSGLAVFWDVFLRKLAHAGEFGILFLLIFWALWKDEGLSFKRVVIISLIIAILYAFSDEFHQYFVPEREAKLMDVAVDCSGIVFTYFVLLLFYIKNRGKIIKS